MRRAALASLLVILIVAIGYLAYHAGYAIGFGSTQT